MGKKPKTIKTNPKQLPILPLPTSPPPHPNKLSKKKKSPKLKETVDKCSGTNRWRKLNRRMLTLQI